MAYAIASSVFRKQNSRYASVRQLVEPTYAFLQGINKPLFVHKLFRSKDISDADLKALMQTALGRELDPMELSRVRKTANVDKNDFLDIDEVIACLEEMRSPSVVGENASNGIGR